MSGSEAVTVAAPGRSRRSRQAGSVIGVGLLAAVAAAVATTLAAALAGPAGIGFEIPEGGEVIPLPGFAVVTGSCCAVGTVIALVLLRFSARPADRFWQTTVSLTAISLVPPLVSGAATETVAALIVLHLVPATTVIPVLTRSLRAAPQEISRSARRRRRR